ncbi:hypothetical protein EDB19DRAFT_1823912 [Suillus lakei]|nr:hypothetical protein EDB19DRAFT_1823912 [Suillus lakei]
MLRQPSRLRIILLPVRNKLDSQVGIFYRQIYFHNSCVAPGLPTDSWKIIHDNEGQPNCRRVAVQELRICRGVEYIDADTKDKKCCQDVSGLTWIDKPAKLAKCCAKDHIWTFDNGDGPTRGGCCMVGLHMHNGRCIPQYTPPHCPPGTFLHDGMCFPVPVPIVGCPVGANLIDDHVLPLLSAARLEHICTITCASQFQTAVCPIGTRMQDGQCVPLPQTCGNGHSGVEPSCACTSHPASNMVIATSFPSLMANNSAPYGKILFCKSTNDCSHGKEVEIDESFYLQDQHGLYTDLKSTKGWVDNAHNGNHLDFTHDAQKAGKFTGTPTCAGGECGIQLRGGPVNGGMGFACPMATPGVTSRDNPVVSEKLRFSEVTCDNH